ncbi:putative LuxR family transcriptional regulator [Actinacidiphila reveromycinica]|uniref:Putative LuxR family transcriptional regulator n=1 Tax=Actinacidiphila reveromycinica TaxID=659352 RepID=A0A7U3UQA4_9ACTN|nr:AAA family ATPase [Streptomyces sp. SN-593]BBA96727.1 putative LuxR family transcriptional regulator [Streptomyces sp. SN-593]
MAERWLGRTRFVGRDRELARVVEALARPPALVLIEGEAGIGKSRLVREAVAATDRDGARTLLAVCPPFLEAFTLGPVVDAVREAAPDVAALGLTAVAGALRPLFPEWSQDLPPAPEPPADAGVARHQLVRALAELLDRAGVEVLVVEDVHWADATTLDFLVYVATRRPRPLTLVLTYRPEEVAADSPLLRLTSRPAQDVCQVRATLGGLPVSDAAGLASSMLGGDRVSAGFAAFLHDRTEGVPLALEECVRLLRDRDDLTCRDGEWARRGLDEIAVPPTIRDSVTERVARLGADARRVLLAAAVLTDPVDERTLAAVTGLPVGRWPAALRASLGSGLLGETTARPGGGLPAGRTGIAFRHVLAARAVYDRAAAHERAAAHRRAGEALETAVPPPVGRLAHHFREAGLTRRWFAYARQAALLALSSGDHRTAAGLLHALITEPTLPPTEVAALAGQVSSHAFTGDPRAGEIARTLRAVVDSGRLGRRDRAAVRAQLGRMLLTVGEYTEAAAVLEQAIPDLADHGYPVASAMTVLGLPLHDSWPVATHLRWLERAEAVASSSEIGPVDRFELRLARMTALFELGEESGWELAGRIDADESSPQAAVLTARFHLNAGHAAMKWGRYADARRYLAAAVDVAGRHGYQRLRDLALVTAGHLDWLTGAWDGLDERLAAWQEVDGEPLIRMDALLVGTQLRVARGGPDEEARKVLAAVREESVRRGTTDLPAEAAGALARVAAEPSADHTAEPVGRLVRKGVWLWAGEVLPEHLAALTSAGRRSEAEELVAAFEDGARGRDAPVLAATLASCRALLAEGRGRPAAAADAWEAAASAWRALPRPYDAAKAGERRARCLLRDGRRTAALAALRAAHREFTSLGARYDADRVRRALDAQGAGAEGPWRPGRRGYGDRLSPRELEVVRLVATGLTNREIAKALSRSPKTVATQLNSAMRKHGVSSRTALAVRVTQAGYDAGAEPGPSPA